MMRSSCERDVCWFVSVTGRTDDRMVTVLRGKHCRDDMTKQKPSESVEPPDL